MPLLVQHAQALGRPGQEAQPRRVIEVSAINNYRAVAIEDDGASGVPCAHALTAAMRRKVSVVLCEGTRSASMTLPPRRMTRSAPTTVSSV